MRRNVRPRPGRADELHSCASTPSARKELAMRRYFLLPVVLLPVLLAAVATILATGSGRADPSTDRALDGLGNNVAHPSWGQAGTPYSRVAAPNYADGLGQMVSGPSPRRVSNRIFNDTGQNLFSENDVSQWGWAWGQFIDHDIGLR